MSAWGFVAAAYAVAGIATLGLTVASYAAMGRAERAADALRRR